ncbi:hypothetical protein ACQ858_08265 [Variovorax ureilyticus]|uniref:hypothetical protein n=1 Tax=Variovorax ureilyticus TaxID=1836198 RepID=UPI003D66425C
MNTVVLYVLIAVFGGYSDHPATLERFATAQDCEEAAKAVAIAFRRASNVDAGLRCVPMKVYMPKATGSAS